MIVPNLKSKRIYGQIHVANLSNLSRLIVGRNYDATNKHKCFSSLLQQIKDDTLDAMEIGTHEYSRFLVSSARKKSAQLQRPTSLKFLDGVQLKGT